MSNSAKSARVKIITYKCATYGIFLFFLGLLQVSFFSKVNIWGATPDLLLGATLTLAMHEDQKSASICGIIAGFFYYSLGGFTYPLYMIFSFLCAYIFWMLSENILGKNHASFLVLAALIYGAKAIFNIFEASLSSSTFNIFNTIGTVVIPEFVSSMVFCSISYLIFSLLTRIFKKSKSRKENIKK